MDAHTVITSLLGGLLIGLATVTYLLSTGRVAGISGIFGRVLSGSRDTVAVSFLIGLLLSPWIGMLIGWSLPQLPHTPASWPKLIGAGLLVGIGTQIGNGCTSGHGVCGIANFSPRSLTATLIFMLVAGIVVALGFGGVL